MPNVVECPRDDCDGEFDAVAASTGFVRDRRGRADIACPECESTWVDLHRDVEPQQDPSYDIGYNGEIERDEEVAA